MEDRSNNNGRNARSPFYTAWYFLQFLCLSLIFCLFGLTAYSQNNPVPLLGITDLRTIDSESSNAEARAFSEFIRKEIESTGLYRVLSRSSMLAILKARKFPLPCHELPCFASMGKLLGADQILAGHLHHDEQGIEITLRLIDVKNARFLKTVYREEDSIESDELFGDWGRSLIFEVIDLKGAKRENLEKEAADGTKPNITPGIPDTIANRYPGMVYIPAGETTVGSLKGDVYEKPPHREFVDAYYIGRYEVTNEDYAAFVQETGHRAPLHWSGGVIPNGLEKHPVTWVSFEDADAYCEWSGTRLPTEAEWIRAARGDSLNVYAWGDEFDKNDANTWEAGRGGTAPVGSYFRGKSIYGVEDMAGNAFEWIADFFVQYPGARKHFEQYDQHLRVLKGGSWMFNSYYARITLRFARSGGEQGRSYGFRVARDG